MTFFVVFFVLAITNKPEFMYPFLKIYQSNLPSLSHGLPSFLGSKTALSTNFKSSAAMVDWSMDPLSYSLITISITKYEQSSVTVIQIRLLIVIEENNSNQIIAF